MFLRFSRCLIKNKVLSDVYVPLNSSVKYIALDQTPNNEKITLKYINNSSLEINKHFEWDTYEVFGNIQEALGKKYKVIDVTESSYSIG